MTKTVTKRFRSGNYMAEVRVKLLADDGAWGPYLSAEDAQKLDRVRKALQIGNISAASLDAQVFEVLPLTG